MTEDKTALRNMYVRRIERLAQGSSMHAKVANRYWLALIVASVAVATLDGGASGGRITMPFELGTVDSQWFYAVCLIILSGIAIAYASAHIQVTGDKETIDGLKRNLMEIEAEMCVAPELRECGFVDEMQASVITPNMNRVSSIPSYVYSGDRRYSRGRSVLYGMLKIVSGIFTYGFPLGAMIFCGVGLWQRLYCADGLCAATRIATIAALYLIGAIAAYCLLVLVFVDWKWTKRKMREWKEKRRERES